VSQPPVLVCHRGASALAPENSLEAFRLAMQYGVDYSELDVHLSRSGELIVTHDPVPDGEAERRMPRLADVFDLVRARMGVYVELKGGRTGAALSELIGRGAADGVRLISGSAVLELARELAEFAPEVPRSILFTPGWQTHEMIAACRDLGATYAHPCFRPIDALLVEEIHQAGLLVMTPHTNDAAEARVFAEIGVDVIATDDPRILVALRAC
jgi:glycerophosphoryl diester phosphodiesterase